MDADDETFLDNYAMHAPPSQRHLTSKMLIDETVLSGYCPLTVSGLILKPAQSVGNLEPFPVEILHEILVHCDLLSLAAFQRVNKFAHYVVGSLNPLQLLRRHFPMVIRAIMGARARHFDVFTLCQVLCTDERCASCGDSGAYFHLLKCSLRSCKELAGPNTPRVILRIPWLDPTSRRTYSGVYCRTCFKEYTVMGLREHISRGCSTGMSWDYVFYID
ncbi:hypothetical protein QBC43DRAFT_292502 [Cladorrhinum sp. PSN259]|nr:hypothetical protein QBC43DRAFT_292502 [Cladorrhinum sp. PSN259]